MGWPYQQKPPMGWPLAPDSGLVPNAGFWLLNENSGGIVQDLSGNEKAGTLTGTAPSWTSGKFGSAVLFPGTDEHIIASSPITATDNYTISVWFNEATQGGTKGIFSIANELLSTLPLLLIQSNSGTLRMYNNGYITIDTITTNRWYNVVVTYNGTNRLAYLDGVYKAIGPANVTIEDNNMYIGNGFNGYFTGLVSHVGIYDHALTAQEIALLYRFPFWMFKDPAEVALLGGYQAVVAGMSGAMTTNTGYWGW